jgi:nicotinamide riboside transporter PnuC
MFDWTIGVMIASVIGTIANIYKKQWCFVIWIFTNITWCIYDLSLGATWQAAQFLIYTGLSIWGLMQWSKNVRKVKK